MLLWLVLLSAAAKAGEVTPPPHLGPHPQDYKFDRQARLVSVQHDASDLDWKALFAGEDRVYFLGENHLVPEMADAFIAHLPDFKAAGITHIALELPDEYQKDFDSWKKMEEQTKELKDLFARCGRGSCEKFFALAKAVRAQSLSLVLVDKPHEGFSMGIDERDQWMAAKLAALLKDPAVRIATFNGANHTRRKNQPEKLRALGHSSKTYCFLTSGVDYSRPRDLADVAKSRINEKDQFEVAESLKTAKLDSKALFVALPSSADYDGYISLPEVLAQKTVGFWMEPLSTDD